MNQEPDTRPIWPDILAIGAWLGGASIVAYAVVRTLWPYPRVVMALIVVIGLVFGMGVISHVGAASEALSCRKRRWWVRFVGRSQLIYEERDLEGRLRDVAFGCAKAQLGRWKQLGWEVAVPSSTEWDAQVPQWARGRRTEILERIVGAFGGGTQFHFRDAVQQ